MAERLSPNLAATERYTTSNARVTLKERFTNLKKRHDLFLSKHGRTIADVATETRLVGGAVEAGLIFVGKPEIARVVSVPVLATDLVDGYAARRDADGATVPGGTRDQEVDKKRSLMVEAALVARGRLDWKHMAVRTATDVFMNKVVRPYFEKRGVDTKAGWAGKASSALVSASEVSAMSESNPQSIQHIATGAKVARVGVYTYEWGKELWRKNKKEPQTIPAAA